MALLFKPNILLCALNKTLAQKAIKNLEKNGLQVTQTLSLDEAKNQLGLVNYDAVIFVEKKGKSFREGELKPFSSYSKILVSINTPQYDLELPILRPKDVDKKLVDLIYEIIESRATSLKAA